MVNSRAIFTVWLGLLSVSLSQWTSGPAAGEEAPANYDFSHCFIPPPECPNKNITFWLYTRETKDNPFEVNTTNFRDAPYKSDVPFIVLIHGYTGWKDYAPNPEIRAALFQKGEFNVISLDYNPIAKEPCYVQAAYSVKTIANCTVRLLLDMMDAMPNTINLDNLHIIGFSLGGQVAGNMGYMFKTLGNVTIKWMTGLDPALPLFDSVFVNPDSRLSEDDAEFLDVHHTCAGQRGIIKPQGKVDFYYNNGANQPGCASNVSCDHYRAVLYYAESINQESKGFWGAPCKLSNLVTYFTTSDICEASNGENTTTLAGYYTPHTARGLYQVQTNSTSPFALGEVPIKSKKRNSVFGR